MLNKVLKRKLNSNEGASLMVALLFFVMCATIGSIILAAATASSGRLKNLEKEDQTYYATSSAAQAISDLVAGKGANTGSKIQFYVIYDKENTQAPSSLDPKDKIIVISNGAEKTFEESNMLAVNLLYENIQSYLTGNIAGLDSVFMQSNNHPAVTVTSENNHMDLIVEKGGSEIKNLSVRAVFAMNGNLDLFVSIRPLYEETDRNNLTLTFYAVKKLEQSVESVEETADGKKKIYQKNLYTVYWDKPYVSKGTFVTVSGGGGS